ncbi:MAG TPA: NotI family restriction endonuclease [bacterium]|nr:NotI family restriction endonuclease [bacterium]
MTQQIQPLAEVFGFLVSDLSKKADRYRANRLCPFNNKVPSCTKDKAKSPLGVCSIYHKEKPTITCPVRFREEWIIADDAASFFFNESTSWSSLTEVRLNDINGKSAGNIDMVLVAYDDDGKVKDFGALEVQAVYISGNVREPFERYMRNPKDQASADSAGDSYYPRPDFLSSSRKRLAPQLLFKGGILHSWNKKIAVAIDKSFFSMLPNITQVSKSEAEIAWFIYDLVLTREKGEEQERYHLKKVDEVYTRFEPALISITSPNPGNIEDFIKLLQDKLEEQIETPPVNKTIERPF